jgi:hypothetical protein
MWLTTYVLSASSFCRRSSTCAARTAIWSAAVQTMGDGSVVTPPKLSVNVLPEGSPGCPRLLQAGTLSAASDGRPLSDVCVIRPTLWARCCTESDVGLEEFGGGCSAECLSVGLGTVGRSGRLSGLSLVRYAGNTETLRCCSWPTSLIVSGACCCAANALQHAACRDRAASLPPDICLTVFRAPPFSDCCRSSSATCLSAAL